MKYCQKCGKEIVDDVIVCPGCGCQIGNIDSNDAPSIGFAILSFFIPILGLILYLAWKDNSPKKAKSAGKGALIGFIISIAICIIWVSVIGAAINSILG